MKKAYIAIPIIAASLVITSALMRKNYTAEAQDFSRLESFYGMKGRGITGYKKVLTVYFSRTGNTRKIANHIRGIAGGDIVEIRAVNPYPENYDAVVKQAKRELESDFRPGVKTRIGKIRSYDLIFIGYPIWWATFPAPVKTFLSAHDLSGKTLVPFCTHEGSGLGRSLADLSRLCPKSTLLEGLAVRGTDAKGARDTVSAWLKKNRITR